MYINSHRTYDLQYVTLRKEKEVDGCGCKEHNSFNSRVTELCIFESKGNLSHGGPD